MGLNHLLAAAVLTSGLALALPGCQTEMAAVPGNAPLVATGTGNTSYSVAQSGMIYVYDKTWNKMVYAGHVQEGQLVRVDTNAGKILLDNQPCVEQAPVGGGSEFQFYLRPDAGVATIERRTVIEHPIQRETVTEREIP